MPVVLERARRRVERLEEAVLDRDLGAGERVQERRLADVRVAGERDGRRLGARPLLPPRRALRAAARAAAAGAARSAGSPSAGRSRAATRPGRACRRRRRGARGASTCRACAAGCTRAARARPGASPRRDTACWAKMSRISCVRSTTRAVSASSSARCWTGSSSSSTISTSARVVGVRAPSAPRACPCRRTCAGRRCARCWTTSPTGSTPRGARELAQLGELVLGVGALREHGEHEPAFGLGLPGARARRGVIGRNYARLTARAGWRTRRVARSPTGSPRARSSSSTSPPRAGTRRRSASTLRVARPGRRSPPCTRATRRSSGSRERRPGVAAARARRPLRHRPGPGQRPGRIEDGAVHGCGASDMKGGVAVVLELVRELAERDPGPVDVALLLFGSEELPPRDNPLPALFDGCAARPRGRIWPILLEPTDLTIQAGCVGNLTRACHLPRASAATPHGPGSADNAIAPRDRRAARVAAHERREAVDRRPAVLRGGLASPGSTAASPTTSCPIGPWRRSTSAIRPDRSPARPRSYVRTLVADRRDRRDRRQLAARRGRRVDAPLVQRAARGGRLPARAEAGVDERRRLHRRGDRRRQLRAGRDPLRAPTDERVEIAALERALRGPPPARRCGYDVERVPALARPPRDRPRIRSSASTRPPRSGATRGLEVIDFGMGDPREPTDPAILAGASRRGARADGLSRRRSGCRSCARRSPAWVGRRFGVALDPDTQSSRRSARRRRSSPSPRSSSTCPAAATPSSSRSPDTRFRSAAPPSRARGSSSSRCCEEHGLPPGSRRRSGRRTGAAPALVWLNYPNNPTGAVAPARLPTSELARARARARLRARLRRGVHASCGSTSRRRRRSSSTT